MKKTEILEMLVKSGVVAVIRAESQDQATQIAEACALGTVAALEITFTVPGAKEVIEHLAKKASHQILLGAGTVLDPETARIAILAGAQFIVSPALNPETARLCNRYQVPYLPGAATIREVIEAMECGADIVDLDNVADWIKAGACAVGVGGNLTAAAKTNDYASITNLALQFVATIRQARDK